MNKNYVKFGLASACLTSAILFGVHTVEASDQSSNIHQNGSDSYGNALTRSTKYELDKKAYEDAVARYMKEKAQYDKDKAAYDQAQTDYNTAKAEYDKQLVDYNKKLEEYNKQVEANEAADKIENSKRRADYEEKLKKFEEESKKAGHFASEDKNNLIFEKEPNAKISIEVKDTGDTGALAMLKYTQKDGSFWKLNHKKLSSDQLSDKALAENKLTDNIVKHFDENVTGYREYGNDPHIKTYPVIAKKRSSIYCDLHKLREYNL